MSGARGSKKSIWDTRFSKPKPKKALAFDECLKLAGWAIDDWKTIKGAHVEIGEGGEILHGMEGKFKNINDIPRKTVKQREGESIEQTEARAREIFAKQDAAKAKENVPKVDLKGTPSEISKKIQSLYADHYDEQIANGESQNANWLYAHGQTKEAHEQRTKDINDRNAFTLPLRQEALEQNYEAIEPRQIGTPFSSEEAIARLATDNSHGGCDNLALGYVAMRAGYDVEVGRTDTKPITSPMLPGLIQDAGGVMKYERGCTSTLTGIKDPAYPENLLRQAVRDAHMQEGKEYLLTCCGNQKGIGHAAIVRPSKEGLQYLELQSSQPGVRGWHTWDLYTWDRFGMYNKQVSNSTVGAAVVDIDDLAKSQSYKDVLPYINKKK